MWPARNAHARPQCRPSELEPSGRRLRRGQGPPPVPGGPVTAGHRAQEGREPRSSCPGGALDHHGPRAPARAAGSTALPVTPGTSGGRPERTSALAKVTQRVAGRPRPPPAKVTACAPAAPAYGPGVGTLNDPSRPPRPSTPSSTAGHRRRQLSLPRTPTSLPPQAGARGGRSSDPGGGARRRTRRPLARRGCALPTGPTVGGVAGGTPRPRTGAGPAPRARGVSEVKARRGPADGRAAAAAAANERGRRGRGAGRGCVPPLLRRLAPRWRDAA